MGNLLGTGNWKDLGLLILLYCQSLIDAFQGNIRKKNDFFFCPSPLTPLPMSGCKHAKQYSSELVAKMAASALSQLSYIWTKPFDLITRMGSPTLQYICTVCLTPHNPTLLIIWDTIKVVKTMTTNTHILRLGLVDCTNIMCNKCTRN